MRAAQELQRVKIAKQLLLSGVRCVSGSPPLCGGHTGRAGRDTHRATDHAAKVHSIEWWVHTADRLAQDVIKHGKQANMQTSSGVSLINKLFLEPPAEEV
jgi:hypothetical protein